MPKRASVATRSCNTDGSTTPVTRTWSASRRARARSSSSGRSEVCISATRSIPSRRRLTSRRTIAARMSTTADCWMGSSRPTAPKSIRPRLPSRKAKMLPGCGSAWKSPIRSTCSSVERSSSSASPLRSMPAASSSADLGDGVPVEALLHEEATRAVLGVDARHAHGRVGTEQQRHLEHDVGLVAEVELGPQADRELREQLAGPETLAERACVAARRWRGARARPGRARSRRRSPAAGSSRRPLHRCAAAPGRSGRSTRRRAAPSRTRRTPRRPEPPSSASSAGRMISTGSGATWFCSDDSSSDTSGGMRSTRVAAICPSFT